MNLTQEILGERLRDARKNLGLTQEAAADFIELPRTALVQIESGNRAVSSLELMKLARLYGRDFKEFVSNEPLHEDPLVLFRRLTGEEETPLTPEITNCIELLREAKKLEDYLGEKTLSLPPVYPFRDPLTYREAVMQGKEIAIRERNRLNLGFAPLPDVAEIISRQSIRAVAVSLRDDISGLFVHHPEYGLAILVNQEHGRARRRFSYAHEYAHALVDRDKSPTPTQHQNANHLIEKRANAFASEFLMPEAGVMETLERMQKGASSRERSLLYDPTSDTAEAHESRNDAGEQRITMREIAILAHEYKVSYDVAVYRLSDMGAVSLKHKEDLLSQRNEGRLLKDRLELYDSESQDAEQPYLRRHLMLLAMEAFRQDKITRGRFRDICRLAGYSVEEMMQIADSLVGAEEKNG